MSDSEARLSLIFAAKDLASGEIGKLHGALSRLGDAGGRVGGGMRSAAGELGGFAKDASIVGAGAALALGAGLLAAGKAAADEQVGIVRLGAALKANVPGFDGNTAAIEKLISAREKLGFSDDDLRQSLGELVVQTHDVSKAQGLQALAMDLARKQGIPLADATDTLIKVNNGQYRALKGLGIAITPVTTAYDALMASTKHATDEQIAAAKASDDAATKTQALGAIQQAASGQAEAYGNTTAGMFASLQIAGQDLFEDLGGLVLPILNKLAVFARDELLPAIRDIVGKVTEWVAANQPLIQGIQAFAGELIGNVITAVQTVGPQIATFVGNLVDVGTKIATEVVPKIQDFVGNLIKPGGVVESIGKVVGPILDNLIPAFGSVVTALFGGGETRGLVPALGDLVGLLWGDGQGPLALAFKFAAGAATFLINAIGFIIDKVGALIDKVREAIAWMQKLFAQDPSQAGLTYAQAHGLAPMPARAGGGPVFPGYAYTVGENRPETLVMGSRGGYIMPSAGGGGSRGGGGGLTVNFNSTWPPSADQAREIAQAVDRELHYGLAGAFSTIKS